MKKNIYESGAVRFWIAVLVMLEIICIWLLCEKADLFIWIGFIITAFTIEGHLYRFLHKELHAEEETKEEMPTGLMTLSLMVILGLFFMFNDFLNKHL